MGTDEDTGPADALVEPPRSRHPVVNAAVRIVVSGAVIAVLLSQGDLDAIGGAIGDARPGYIAAAFGAILAGLAAGAIRWQAYLRPLRLALPGGTVLRLYFVGTFFNAFLPTGVGGDAYKAMRLRRGPGTLAPALASVLLDRIAGVVGLAIIGVVGVSVRAAGGDRSRAVALAGLLVLAVLGTAAAIFTVGDRLLGRSASPGWWQLRWKLRRMLGDVVRAGRDPRAASVGIAAGLAFQGLVLASHLLLLSALRLRISVSAVVVVLVISQLATTVPVTINGLGFREGAYVWGLGVYGIQHDPALAFAFLVLGVLLATSFVGGIVYVAAGGEVRRSP